MRVIPGSHKQGVLEHDNVQDPNLLNRRGEVCEWTSSAGGRRRSKARRDVVASHEHRARIESKYVGWTTNRVIVRFVTNLSTNRDRQVMRARATRIAVICGWWSRRQASARDLANGRFLLLVGALGSDIDRSLKKDFRRY